MIATESFRSFFSAVSMLKITVLPRRSAEPVDVSQQDRYLFCLQIPAFLHAIACPAFKSARSCIVIRSKVSISRSFRSLSGKSHPALSIDFL